MSIYGPKQLCDLVNEQLHSLLPALREEHPPHIILSPPETIQIEATTNIKEDKEAKQEFEEALNDWFTQQTGSYEQLLSVVEKHRMLPPSVEGSYTENFDFIVIDPRQLISVMQMQRQGEHATPLTERVTALRVPYVLAHELAHWTICKNEVGNELRAAVQQAEYSFEKARDGPFTYGKGEYANHAWEKEVEQIEKKMERLNFPQWHEHFADKVAGSLRSQPFHQIVTLPTTTKDYIAAVRNMFQVSYRSGIPLNQFRSRNL